MLVGSVGNKNDRGVWRGKHKKESYYPCTANAEAARAAFPTTVEDYDASRLASEPMSVLWSMDRNGSTGKKVFNKLKK
jgi:hypothetical protein